MASDMRSSTQTSALTEKPDPVLLQEAAGWFAVLMDDEVTQAEKQGWRSWCDQSPEHALAWQYIERVSQRFHAFENSQQQNDAYCALNSAQQVEVGRRASLRLLGLLAVVAAGGWAGWRYPPLGGRVAGLIADYRTGIGEITPVKLADNSELWLNTDSAVNVAFSSQRRLLELVRGEVLVDTASDKQRPFVVATYHGQLRALGTRFAVFLGADYSRLSVYEGAVEIEPASSGVSRVIEAGHQAVFNSHGVVSEARVQEADQIWARGLLVAERQPLEAFVEQAARYHPHLIQVDASIADIPVMGTFPAQDLDQILQMLEESLAVRVEHIMPWWIRIVPA